LNVYILSVQISTGNRGTLSKRNYVDVAGGKK